MRIITTQLCVTAVVSLVVTSLSVAQPSNAPRQAAAQSRPVVVRSPEVLPDSRVRFRIFAPKAENVRLGGTDIPGLGRDSQNAEMTKDTNDVWEVTIGPVQPGAYRYHFDVDGVAVIDPRNPTTSESNGNTWSLVYVPGADFMETKAVPHGAVAEVTYYSSTLKRFRRMHVYTPPDYDSGTGKYPVFYLLHGAFDSDNSWSSVGRAGFILDNLIAAKQAKPMVVVMPAGHTGPFVMGSRGGAIDRAVNDFVEDFEKDIMPFVETRYRVYSDRKHRAIAGLSMGGAQSLNIAFRNLDRFGYLGVFSSGVFGIAGRPGGAPQASGPTWEERHQEALGDPKLKDGLHLVWFATGKDDFLIETSRATVQLLKKHGFNVVFNETSGAHTWIVWRQYLNEFAPQLFQ